jgi:hypothetical protein
MPKFNEVFEFESKEYIKSDRDATEVQIGDIVKIHSHIPGSENWGHAGRAAGTIQKVTSVHSTIGVQFEDVTGIWRWEYFDILEPVMKTNPRPHAELIKQWADDDSLEVQFKGHNSGKWLDSPIPSWSKDYEYRIKPKTVPAWRVLYEFDGEFDLTAGHYKTEEEFYGWLDNGEKFIRFISETEKQVQA